MAFLETVVVFALVVLLCCWPHISVRNESKVDFVGAVYAVPLMLIVVIALLVMSRC